MSTCCIYEHSSFVDEMFVMITNLDNSMLIFPKIREVVLTDLSITGGMQSMMRVPLI